MRKVETYEWWPELVGLKDELTAAELAERFGVTADTVRSALKRNGLSAKNGRRPSSKSHLIQPYEHLLGERSDGEVAELAGVGLRLVATYRCRKGIAAYKPRRKSAIESFEELLGKVQDTVIARKAGVTPAAVRQYRARRGIRAFRSATKPSR